MLEQRSQLPVFQYKSALIEAVKRNRVVVVKGATGCGKTTQVCNLKFLLMWIPTGVSDSATHYFFKLTLIL